ncbi:MAG TPA: T9SS type A sorting domain-containing protein [Bacteroidetes bacterium]|nr:T9SS type A sorting domain-containing protein [Bacteroidota bacterium]
MKKIFYFILFLSFSLNAQNSQPHCGLDFLIKKELAKNPNYQKELDAYARLIPSKSSTVQRRGPIYYIPVVVHVIHEGEGVGIGTNLSEAQILSQIDILNDDYSRQNSDVNSTPSSFRDEATDTEIQFCLAKLDPQGNPTSGITRHNYPNISNINFIENTIKEETSWAPRKYLNIWTVKMPNSTYLGYSFLPTSSKRNTPQDGAVISYEKFGYVSSSNRGRTVTHEIGHYLGLKHPWGDNDADDDPIGCPSDDGVADTPNSAKPYFNCPSFPKSSCNSTDMFMNYMDYVNDDCMNLFTIGQANLMRSIIDDFRSGLLENSAATCESVDCVANYDLNTTEIKMGFEEGEDYACWIIENTNNDEETWGIYEDTDNGETGAKTGSQFLAYYWNEDQTTAANDYIFSPFFKIQAGRVYEIKFSYATAQADGTNFPERFEVGYSFEQSSSDFGIISDDWIFDPANNSFPNFQTSSLFFNSDGEGQVSLGFHIFSDANQYALQIDDVTIRDVGATGTEDKILAEGFNIFPNPSQSKFTVDILLEKEQQQLDVKVQDILGRVIASQSLTNVKNNQVSFDLSNQPKGMYFVSLSANEKRATKKILIVE